MTATSDEAVSDVVAIRERSFLVRHGLSNLDVYVLLVAFLMPCLYVPVFFLPFNTPRTMLLLVSLLPGLISLAVLARRKDRAAVAALALVMWAVCAALLSDSVVGSLIGYTGQDLSVLTLASSLGLWALARFMTPNGRRLAVPVVLTGLAINAAVGIAQMLLRIEGSRLALRGGRAIGLTANAAYFGTLMALGAVACIVIAVRGKQRPWAAWIGAAGFALAAAFSGTRGSVVATVVLALCIAGITRRRSAVFAGLWAGAGLAIGSVIVGALGTSRGEGSRLSDVGLSTGGGRLSWWADGFAAFLERPITGWGLGRFRTAIQGRATASDVANGYIIEQHMDPHNIVIGMLFALGLPGLLLLTAFVVTVVRNSSGPLALGSLAGGVSYLLQPVPATTLPLLLIALGVGAGPWGAFSRRGILGGAGDDDGDDAGDQGGNPTSGEQIDESNAPLTLPRPISLIMPVSALVGLAAAGWLAVAEARFSAAHDANDVAALIAAAEMYYRDPIIENVTAEKLLPVVAADQKRIPELIATLQRSVDYEPTRPLWLAELARVVVVTNDLDQGETLARRALELQPTHPPAWSVLLTIGVKRDDADLIREARTALCATGADDMCAALAAENSG